MVSGMSRGTSPVLHLPLGELSPVEQPLRLWGCPDMANKWHSRRPDDSDLDFCHVWTDRDPERAPGPGESYLGAEGVFSLPWTPSLCNVFTTQ